MRGRHRAAGQIHSLCHVFVHEAQAGRALSVRYEPAHDAHVVQPRSLRPLIGLREEPCLYTQGRKALVCGNIRDMSGTYQGHTRDIFGTEEPCLYTQGRKALVCGNIRDMVRTY